MLYSVATVIMCRPLGGRITRCI